jgi:hypothetical protein
MQLHIYNIQTSFRQSFIHHSNTVQIELVIDDGKTSSGNTWCYGDVYYIVCTGASPAGRKFMAPVEMLAQSAMVV